MQFSKIALIGLLCFACDKNITKQDSLFRQYAASVIGFSTEYNAPPGAWSSIEALGPENVYPAFGDIDSAWASLSEDDQREFIELGYDVNQTVEKIEIFETYNPGAIDTVYLRDASTMQWQLIWTDSAFIYGDTSRIFIINISETSYNVDGIRLDLNSPVVPGWNEIDAVAISGIKEE